MNYVESELQNEQKEILIENIRFLLGGDFNSFRQQCPVAYSNLSRNRNLEYLLRLHFIALNYIKSENFVVENSSSMEGEVIFSVDNKDSSKEKDILLSHYNLIAKNEKGIYTILSYCTDQIESIEEQAIIWGKVY